MTGPRRGCPSGSRASRDRPRRARGAPHHALRTGFLFLVHCFFIALLRLFVQLFVYDPRLWRGHALHTTLHVAFTVFWVYLVAVYGGAFWAQIGHRMPFVP